MRRYHTFQHALKFLSHPEANPYKGRTVSLCKSCNRWHIRRHEGRAVVNVDSAYRDGQGYVGISLLHAHGAVELGRELGAVASSTEAELRGIQKAISVAYELGFESVSVRSDCLPAVGGFNQKMLAVEQRPCMRFTVEWRRKSFRGSNPLNQIAHNLAWKCFKEGRDFQKEIIFDLSL